MLSQIADVILAATAVVFGYAVCVFVKDYVAATGTIWQRLLAASRQSSTYLWAKVVGAAAYVVTWLDQAAAVLNMPEVQAILQKSVTPTRLGIFGMVAMGVAALARFRHIILDRLSAASPQQAAGS
jgi:hypothetical protein